MAFRKLFFKRVQGYNRDNYLLQEGDIALDEDDFQLYRGDGSTIGGVVIAGATSAVQVSTGNGTDISITGGESTATGSTGGNTVITGGIGVATGGNVNINGGNGSTDGNINIGTENTTLITIGTSGNNIDFPATTTIDFTGATVTGLGVSGIANDILNDTTPQLGGNLDLNNFDITGTGDINITGAVTASGGVTLSGTTDVDTITTDGLTITDNNVSANRTNDDLILSASGTGDIVINGDMKFYDDDKLKMGDNDDLQIYHHNNGTGIIQNAGAGQLQLRANTIRLLNSATDEDFAFFRDDGAVELYYNNAKTFETTATGVKVTGNLTLGSTTAVSSVFDEDNLASDSATALATQQSIKAYVDGRFTQTTTTVNTLATDGLTLSDNNVSANRSNDDLILSSSGTGSININGTVTGTGVLDEDDMASNSANHLATQQSIKAYVDSQSGGGGSSLQSRATKAGTTGSLADAAQADLDITGFKAYALLTISTDRAARVRLYVSAATRTADASRAEGTDPTSDAGLIAEVITTGAQTVIISPGAYGFNLESSPTTTIPCRVTNKSGSTSTVQVTLNVLQLEA